MEAVDLTPSSYIVLGMVSAFGSATSYDIHQWAESSVGHFWPFSRAQLYAEPRRLTEAGLLSDEQEQGGRRRRRYSVTEAGRAALGAWLQEPTEAPTEIRDIGLLKLYFSQLSSRDDLIVMAQQQVDAHQQRLTMYQTLQAELSADEKSTFALLTLEMGVRFEQMAIGFWRDVMEQPPVQRGCGGGPSPSA